MNIDLMRAFVDLRRRKSAIDAELDEVKRQLDALGQLVVTELATAGVGKVEVDHGGKLATVYASSIAFPKMREGVTRDDVVAALKACPETAAMVSDSYNSNTFAAWCRERVGEMKQPLPPAIDAVVELAEKLTAGMNESTRKQSASAKALDASVASNS